MFNILTTTEWNVVEKTQYAPCWRLKRNMDGENKTEKWAPWRNKKKRVDKKPYFYGLFWLQVFFFGSENK